LLGAERDLTDTSKVCPDDIMGETHMDGELISSLSWTLHSALGAAAADQLVWGALTLLTTGGSLGDYANGLVQSANDLVAQGQLTAADVTTVQDTLAQRGLDDCGHELALSPAEPRSITMFGLQFVGQQLGASCQQLKTFGFRGQSLFHFVTTPAPTDTALRFGVDLQAQGTGSVDWSIYVRRNEHVGFNTAGVLPKVDKYDYSVEDMTATTGELVIDAASDPPFDPASTYHMVITHQNCPITRASVTATLLGEGGAGGAGGGEPVQTPAAPTIEAAGGCGCRLVPAAGDTSSMGAAWMWLAALAPAGTALRRRLRRRG